MLELLTDMWMGLAGAGLIGLVLGWAFRGAFLPRPKTVNVAPKATEPTPVGLTEEQEQALLRAEQADAAMSALETRVKAAQEAAAQYQAELTEAKANVSSLRAELEEARAADNGGAAVMAGLAGAAAGAVGGFVAGSSDAEADEETEAKEEVETPTEPLAVETKIDPQLEWRNRFLEARVRELDRQLAEKNAAEPEGATPVAPVVDTSALEAELSEARSKLAEAETQLAGFADLEAEVSRLKASQEDAEARLQSALSERDEIKTKIDEAGGINPVAAGVAGAALGGAAAFAGSMMGGEKDEAEAEAEAEAISEPANDAPAIEPSELAKLKWQNKYLKARTLFLEENGITAQPEVIAAEPVADTSHEVDTLKSELTVLKAELSRVTQADNEAEKELAGLRWRNRYLEGRLKYLEAASLDAASDADDSTDRVAAALAEISRSVDAKEAAAAEEIEPPAELEGSVVEEPRMGIPPVIGLVPGSVSPPEADMVAPAEDVSLDEPAALEESVTVEEAVFDHELAKEEPSEEASAVEITEDQEVRPPSLEAPDNGAPDDLKRIGGIGPKIEGILNELGIFYYDQVAEWSDAEAAWVDSYLRFQGRVQREKWVDQAVSLKNAKANPLG